MPFTPPTTVNTPFQLQQLENALQNNSTPSYTFLGQLWRNTLTNLSGGLVDVMAISQHNRDIKNGGGSTTSSLLEAIGSAVVAGQDRFLNSSGYAGDAASSVKSGAIVQSVKQYLPWLIIGIGGITTLLVYAFRKRR